MNLRQLSWRPEQGWTPAAPVVPDRPAHLILAFGTHEALNHPDGLAFLQRTHPGATVLACSTAGEICGPRLAGGSAVATIISFEHSQVRGAQVELSPSLDSYQAGGRLAQMLPTAVAALEGRPAAPLRYVLVLADGMRTNGVALTAGLSAHLPAGVVLAGGLAGDGERFLETQVTAGGPPSSGVIAVAGIYSNRLKTAGSVASGWMPFGPERLVTRSSGRTLYELDGRPALDLYKQYLGDQAQGLPLNALKFPLGFRSDRGERTVLRAFLSVNEAEQSMTFAADITEGSYARLMRSNANRLVDSSRQAALEAQEAMGETRPQLVIVVSCISRRLILRQRTDEFVEELGNVFGPTTDLTGFFSYGEIGPINSGAPSEFFNEVLVLSALAEL